MTIDSLNESLTRLRAMHTIAKTATPRTHRAYAFSQKDAEAIGTAIDVLTVAGCPAIKLVNDTMKIRQ